MVEKLKRILSGSGEFQEMKESLASNFEETPKDSKVGKVFEKLKKIGKF